MRPTEKCRMYDCALLLVLLAAVLSLGAWREYRSDNPRDARLMAAFSTGGMLAGAAAWLG